MTTQNDEMPRLSALVCTRNGARTIEACLEALCTQEGLDPGAYEIIIVDNNSTDETARIARETLARYDVPCRVVHENRPGKGYAFMSGLRLCRGDYVTIVDDDNVICCDFLSRTVRLFDDNPDVGMVGSNNALSADHVPNWFESISGRFACTITGSLHNLLRRVHDDYDVYESALPHGAGSSLRRQPLVDAFDQGFFLIGGVNRGACGYILGEDLEVALLFTKMNWRFAVSEYLRLDHLIAPDRLTERAALDLAWRQGSGGITIQYLMLQSSISLTSIRSSWAWLVGARFKHAVTETLGQISGRRTYQTSLRRRCQLRHAWSAFWLMLISRDHLGKLARKRAQRPWVQLRAEQYYPEGYSPQ